MSLVSSFLQWWAVPAFVIARSGVFPSIDVVHVSSLFSSFSSYHNRRLGLKRHLTSCLSADVHFQGRVEGDAGILAFALCRGCSFSILFDLCVFKSFDSKVICWRKVV